MQSNIKLGVTEANALAFEVLDAYDIDAAHVADKFIDVNRGGPLEVAGQLAAICTQAIGMLAKVSDTTPQEVRRIIQSTMTR